MDFKKYAGELVIWSIEYPDCTERYFTSLEEASGTSGVSIEDIIAIDQKRSLIGQRFDFKIFKRERL